MKSKNITVEVVNKSVNELPSYAYPTDAGMDLRADFRDPTNITAHNCDWDPERETFIMFSGGRAAIPTGISIAVPEGYELQIRPRSGLAIKNGISVTNTPGTVDCHFRGEVKVILINLSEETFEIKQGDRIAQAVLNKIEHIEWKPVEKLQETDRGENGFGSTSK